MKKYSLRLALILSFFFTIFLVSPLTTHAQTVNLFNNPGFETGDTEGWTIESTTRYGVAVSGDLEGWGAPPVVVKSGLYALHALISDSNNLRITLKQNISVQPDTLYNIGYYGITSSIVADGSGAFPIRIYDTISVNGHQLILNYSDEQGVGSDPTNYKRIVASYYTGADETMIDVSIRLTAGGTNYNLYSYDDFFMYPDTTPITWPSDKQLTLIFKPGDSEYPPVLSALSSNAVDDGAIYSYKLYADGQLLSNTVWENTFPKARINFYFDNITPDTFTFYKIEACDAAGICTTDGPTAVSMTTQSLAENLQTLIETTNINGVNGMLAILEKVVNNITNNEDVEKSINLLHTFINQVNAAYQSDKLTEQQAQGFTDKANYLINLLQQ